MKQREQANQTPAANSHGIRPQQRPRVSSLNTKESLQMRCWLLNDKTHLTARVPFSP